MIFWKRYCDPKLDKDDSEAENCTNRILSSYVILRYILRELKGDAKVTEESEYMCVHTYVAEGNEEGLTAILRIYMCYNTRNTFDLDLHFPTVVF